MEKLTKSLEKYLSVVYFLSKENKKLSPKNLGDITGHNAASVLEFVKGLQKKGYVEYKPYKGIKITDLGKKYAKEIELKKEIVSKFFNKFLLLDGKELESQTEKLEYYIDESLIERFNHFLDFISFCPAEVPSWFDGIKSYMENGEMSEKCANCIENCLSNNSKPKCKG